MCNELNRKQELHNTNNEKGYINWQTGEVLDLERVSTLPDNAMLKVRPDLWIEWDFENNNELGYDIWKMTKGVAKKVHWICRNENSHNWEVDVKERCRPNAAKNCPYCASQRLHITNCLATKNPQLASEWHPTLNGELTPYDVISGANKKAWWVCGKGHEWEANIGSRNRGKGCPYCNNLLLCKESSLEYLFPEITKEWHPSKNGNLTPDNISAKNSKKVWWLGTCGHEWESKISNRTSVNSGCPHCPKSSSFSERIMYNILKQLQVDFSFEKPFSWSNNKRYDFHINGIDIIIEMHGLQHFGRGFQCKGAKTLEEEQANDQYKYELAIQNGIKPENYIVIDCRYSDFEYIKNNIMSSNLSKKYNLHRLDWHSIHINSQKDIVFEMIDLWNFGKSLSEISNITKKHKATIGRELKRFSKIGLCKYTTEESKTRAVIFRKKNNEETRS